MDSSDSATVVITVTPVNDAPTLAPIPVAITETGFAFTAVGSDVDAGDTLAYSLGAGAPAGAMIDPTTGLFAWTPAPNQLGTFTFAVRVTDSGGLFAERTVTLTTLGVVGGELIYVGSAGGENVQFTPAAGGGVDIRRNGQLIGTFSAVSRIVAHGLGGNDDIRVAGGLGLTARLHGGAGHDQLVGGVGNNVLFGGSENDLLVGGQGHDLVDRQDGEDQLIGTAHNDILIGGFTLFDQDGDALDAILEVGDDSAGTTAARAGRTLLAGIRLAGKQLPSA